jgi:hypothetical protein
MARRCVTIRLDPGCETPATRTFKGNPVGEVRGGRGHFVSLALTIIRAWIVAGQPKTPTKALASYEDWSDLIRQPLLWLGLPDPAASVYSAMAADPDKETLGLLLFTLEKAVGNKPMMVRDMVELASPVSLKPALKDLHEVLCDIAAERGQINRKRLGRWISRHAGRIVDGLKFEKVTSARNAEQWRVARIKSASPVSSVSSVTASPSAPIASASVIAPPLIH